MARKRSKVVDVEATVAEQDGVPVDATAQPVETETPANVRNGGESSGNGQAPSTNLPAVSYVGPDQELTRMLSDAMSVSNKIEDVLSRVTTADDESLKNMEMTAQNLGSAAWRIHVAVRHEAISRIELRSTDAEGNVDKESKKDAVSRLCLDFGGISWSTLYADARIQKYFFVPRADVENEEDEEEQIKDVSAAADTLVDKSFFTIASNAPGGIDGKRNAVLYMAAQKIKNNGVYTVAEAREYIRSLKGTEGATSASAEQGLSEEETRSSIEGNVSSLLAAIEQAYDNCKETNESFYVWRNPDTLNWTASSTPNPNPPHIQIEVKPTSAGVMPLLPGESWTDASDAEEIDADTDGEPLAEGGFLANTEGEATGDDAAPAGDEDANQDTEDTGGEWPDLDDLEDAE